MAIRLPGGSVAFSPMFRDTLNTRHDGETDAGVRDIEELLKETKVTTEMPPISELGFGHRVHHPLPPWEEALALVNDFFQYQHRLLPLFDPPKFIASFGSQYTDDPPRDSAWWASLNVVLAISSRRRQESFAGDCALQHQASDYVANAMGVLLEVMMQNISLASVQAISALSWFYIGTSQPQPACMLSAAAVRLAYNIGLHDPEAHADKLPADKELGERVFWTAWCIDHHLSFRTGRPLPRLPDKPYAALTIDHQERPASQTLENNRSTASHLYNIGVKLSLIETDVSSWLGSSKSSASTTEDQAAIRRHLKDKLENWSQDLPQLDMRWSGNDGPDPEIQREIIRLNMRYLECIIIIHRVHRSQNHFVVQESITASNASPDIDYCLEMCASAARSIAQLVAVVPKREDSFCW